MAFKDYRDLIRQMERDMQQLTDEVFRGFFDQPAGSGRFWYPPVDVVESQTHLLIKVEIAGVKAEDLQVSLSADDRVLTITGMRKEAQADRGGRLSCHQLEIYFGPFERAVPLPIGVAIDREGIRAIYRDGFLFVSIPKMTGVEIGQSRSIPITCEQPDTDDIEPNKE